MVTLGFRRIGRSRGISAAAAIVTRATLRSLSSEATAIAMSDSADLVAREALRLLDPFPDNWVPAQPGIDHGVVIVG